MVLLCYPKLKQVLSALHSPIILINHALTRKPQVIGESGWWNDNVDNYRYQKYTISLTCQGMVSIQPQLKIIEILLLEILSR
jgi:hypothetical protein